ncbi:Dynactin subunit 4 [Plecturocebus cupreus]
MPSAEAKLKKSRCANRFDCPGCRPALHPGRGHRLTASRRAKATVRKACYVACGFCRRASRDVRMADKPAARRRRFAGTWKPSRPADQQTDGTLSAAQREKVERDRRKLARRGNGMPGLFRTPVVQAWPPRAAHPSAPSPDFPVPVPPKELVLAGKGAAAGRNALAEPQDFPDGPHNVAFRKAHKVSIFMKVTPQREEGEVSVCFKVKRDFNNLAAPIRPMEESDQGTEVIGLTPRVELSLGPRPR